MLILNSTRLNFINFLNTFITCDNYLKNTNTLINHYSVAPTYLRSAYSNMNDLMTSDITTVSLSTLYWGQDLIRLGKALDLSLIEYFGLPSALLKTLAKKSRLIDASSLFLI